MDRTEALRQARGDFAHTEGLLVERKYRHGLWADTWRPAIVMFGPDAKARALSWIVDQRRVAAAAGYEVEFSYSVIKVEIGDDC